MSDVLTFLRESSPALRDVDDATLTEFAADTMPQLADLDPDFDAEVKRVRPPASFTPVIGMPEPRAEMPPSPQLVPTGTGQQIPVIPTEAQKELASEAVSKTKEQTVAPMIPLPSLAVDSVKQLGQTLLNQPNPTLKSIGVILSSDRGAGVATGLYDIGKGVIEFAESPAGAVTALSGGGDRIGQALLGMAFGADMALKTPEAARQAGKLSVEGEDAEIARSLTALIGQTGLAGVLLGGGVSLGKRAIAEVRGREIVPAEKLPAESGIEFTQRQQARGEAPSGEGKAYQQPMPSSAVVPVLPVSPPAETAKLAETAKEVTPNAEVQKQAQEVAPVAAPPQPVLPTKPRPDGRPGNVDQFNRPLRIEKRKWVFDAPEGVIPDAVQEPKAGKVHENVPAQPGRVAGEVPAAQGAEGVRVSGAGEAPAGQPEVAVDVSRPGPGAASPTEFGQRAEAAARQVVAGTRPPGPSKPVARGPNVSVDAPPPRDYYRHNYINSPQWLFYFGRLGQAAKVAWEKLNFAEADIRESTGRDVKIVVQQAMQSLPRLLRKGGGKAFFELLDGRKLEEVEAEWIGKPGGDKVIASAREVKQRLEDIRATIRDIKFDSYKNFLLSQDRALLESMFQNETGRKIDTTNYTKDSLADGLARTAYPDDWGIADGSYLPHLFQGSWRIVVRDASGNERFVTRAKTVHEAKAQIYKLAKDNPELAAENFTVTQDTVIPADVLRLGDGRFWRIVKQATDKGFAREDITDAMRGVVGRKAGKQKWWGSLKKREGFQNYSKDFERVMSSYLSGFHRWRVLSQLSRDLMPLVDQVKREGRPFAAERLEGLYDRLWGKPDKSTLQVDAWLRQMPGIRNWVKPMALERWSRAIRSLTSAMTLGTVRFSVLNRLQPLQGLYPMVGERIMAKAKLLQHSKEGRALLEQAGVDFDPGQYSSASGFRGKVTRARERWSGERGNSEIAYLAMYLHGLERGLPAAEAMRYAKMRGQLMTQFTPFITDTPQILEGPISQLLFQYKRFPIKQSELLVQLAAEKNVPALIRYFAAMSAIGGLTWVMKAAMSSEQSRHRMRQAIADEVGEDMADSVMYGLPGMLGADMTGSLILWNEPLGNNVWEKASRFVAGPAVSISVEQMRNLAAQQRAYRTPAQRLADQAARIPALKQFSGLYALLSGDFDVRSPSGQVRFRRELSDVLANLGAFRSTREANKQMALDTIVELQNERNDLRNAYFVGSQGGDAEAALDAINKFNTRWPEFPITAEELDDYMKDRQRLAEKTTEERTAGKRYAPLIAP